MSQERGAIEMDQALADALGVIFAFMLGLLIGTGLGWAAHHDKIEKEGEVSDDK